MQMVEFRHWRCEMHEFEYSQHTTVRQDVYSNVRGYPKAMVPESTI